jgi:hypothetical protein
METVACLKAYIQRHGSAVSRQSPRLRAQEREGDSNSFSGRLYTLLAVYNVLCRWATSMRGAKDRSLFIQLGFLFGKAIRLKDNYLASPAAYS